MTVNVMAINKLLLAFWDFWYQVLCILITKKYHFSMNKVGGVREYLCAN